MTIPALALGLLRARTGQLQGQMQGEEAAGALRTQAIRDALLASQAQYYQAQANAPKETLLNVSPGGAIFDTHSRTPLFRNAPEVKPIEVSPGGTLFNPATNQPIYTSPVAKDRNIDPLSDQGVAQAIKRATGEAQAKQQMSLGSERLRELQPVIQTMRGALQQMNALYQKNPNAAVTPAGAAAVRGMGNVPIIGGMLKGATDAAANRMMDPDQNQFRQAFKVWVHNYAATLPKARVSPQLLANLEQGFMPQPGIDDPETVRNFIQSINDVTDRLGRAFGGQGADLSDLPGYEGTVVAPSQGVGTGGPRSAVPRAAPIPGSRYRADNPFAPGSPR